jgi:hypothetical protein
MVVNKSCLRVNNSLENEEQDLGKAHLTIIAESVNLVIFSVDTAAENRSHKGSA